VERQSRRLRLRDHAQVRALAGGPQVGDGRRAAEAAPGRELVIARALLPRAVEVVIAGDAKLGAAGDDGLDELVPAGDVGGPYRTVRAMPFAFAAHVVLELAEIRQDVAPRPPWIAGGGPGVVILRLAPDV